MPEGVSQAGSNLSAISVAFSRKTLSPDRSYALRSPPTTLDCHKQRLDFKYNIQDVPFPSYEIMMNSLAFL